MQPTRGWQATELKKADHMPAWLADSMIRHLRPFQCSASKE
jgi:hypothetical protein